MTFNSFRKKADKTDMRIGLGLSIFFLIGCMPPPGGYGPGGYGNNYYGGASTGAPGTPPPQPRTDAEYENRKANDPDRQAVLDRAKRNGREDACEDEGKNHECRDQCKEIYKSRDREDCEELPVDQIERLLDVHKIFKNPSSDKLDDLDLEDVEVYFNVSIEAFEILIRDYGKSDVEDVLYWMTADEDVAELMADEDDDYRTLDILLSEFGRVYDSSNLTGLFKDKRLNIYRNLTLLEVAIYQGNEPAVDYFLEYFFERDNRCDNEEETTLACFTEICEIGKEFEERNRQDFLDYSIFASYIDDIIDEGINAASKDIQDPGGKWCKGTTNKHEDCGADKQITDIDDLGDDWTADGSDKGLCGGLPP